MPPWGEVTFEKSDLSLEVKNLPVIEFANWKINNEELEVICYNIGRKKEAVHEFKLSMSSKYNRLLWYVPYTVKGGKVMYVDATTGEVLVYDFETSNLVVYKTKSQD